MSVESTELERSALEGKDRDELQTIAEAMGGSPGTRARKAEIVDLILELAGVTAGSGDNGGPAASAGEAESSDAPAEAKATEQADEAKADDPPAEQPDPKAEKADAEAEG